MSDFRDLLERERRRFAMRDGSVEGLERRRDRKRRNGQMVAGVLALLIAAAGVGGGLYAFRASPGAKPGVSPSPSTGPTVGSSPTSTAPVNLGEVPPAVSGPLRFADDQHGWVVVGGDILATADGGGTWNPQYTEPLEIAAVAFADAHHGWGLSASGLLQTSDGGSHWADLGQPAGSLRSIQFVSPEVGWGISGSLGDYSARGQVMRTTDGGATWQGVTMSEPIDSVCFADPTIGWAAGGTTLLRTTDGGQSWTGGPLEFGQGEPWTATVGCSSNGNEAFVLLQDGGAAGHIAYVAYQAIDDGEGGYSVQFVLQEAGTHPLGSSTDWYDSEDPYPGPFTVAGNGTAYFLNHCPPCPAPSVHLTRTAGEPAFVGGRLPVPTGDLPAEPIGMSFVSLFHGWVLLEVSGSKAPNWVIYETPDGGRTWTWASSCDPQPSVCIRPRG